MKATPARIVSPTTIWADRVPSRQLQYLINDKRHDENVDDILEAYPEYVVLHLHHKFRSARKTFSASTVGATSCTLTILAPFATAVNAAASDPPSRS